MRLLSVLAFGLTGAAILAGLGVWQVQRLAWKEALLARIESRIDADPGPVPAAPDPVADLYRATAVSGRVAGTPFTVFGTWRGYGAGVRVVSPLDTEDAGRILVDLGIAPWAAGSDPADAAARAPEPGAAVTVRGHLDWPDDGGGDDGGADRLTRDVAAMARLTEARPVLVVAAAVDPPIPALTAVPVGIEGIPNNHLGYAVQWFGLAAVWAGMTLYLAWRIRRRTI